MCVIIVSHFLFVGNIVGAQPSTLRNFDQTSRQWPPSPTSGWRVI
jgi:hypothetical protein